MPLLHLVNWNVNGIRSIIKKDFIKDISTLQPDILCLQETKAGEEDVNTILSGIEGYCFFANCSKARKGYSGTAIVSRIEPVSVAYDMNVAEHDQEGRVIMAEFEKFILVTVYSPNSGDGLKRLDYRQKWDQDFLQYIRNLQAVKPVIISGDLNVAHTEKDISRAKENYNKSAGYTQAEINGFENLLKAGFTDSFRHFHPDEIKYTYWNYLYNARARNAGWRIDYFLVQNNIMENVKEALIYNEFLGSDHCPVGLKLEI